MVVLVPKNHANKNTPHKNNDFTMFSAIEKKSVEEILRFALEMRRRVKEQQKKIGGMEFYDVNFSYIDNETFSEEYVPVPEQGGSKLIPEGMSKPGHVYTVGYNKSGMLGVYKMEMQMTAGNGKFEKTGLGTDRDAKEAVDTAYRYLKACKVNQWINQSYY